MRSLVDLNADCLLEIFDYLDFLDVIHLCEINNSFDDVISSKLLLGMEFDSDAFRSEEILQMFLDRFGMQITHLKIGYKPLFFKGSNEEFQKFLIKSVDKNVVKCLDIGLERGMSSEHLKVLSEKFQNVKYFTFRQFKPNKNSDTVDDSYSESTNFECQCQAEVESDGETEEGNEIGEQSQDDKIEEAIEAEEGNINADLVDYFMNEDSFCSISDSESYSSTSEVYSGHSYYKFNNINNDDMPIDKELNEFLEMIIDIKSIKFINCDMHFDLLNLSRYHKIEIIAFINCRASYSDSKAFRNVILQIGSSLKEFTVNKSPFCEPVANFCVWPRFYSDLMGEVVPNLVSLNLSMWAGCGPAHTSR